MLKIFYISIFFISIFNLTSNAVAEGYGKSGERFLTELSDTDLDSHSLESWKDNLANDCIDTTPASFFDAPKYDSSQFQIDFGILESRHNKLNCKHEFQMQKTKVIPYKNYQRVGFVVTPKTNDKYKASFVIYSPPQTINIGGGHPTAGEGDIITGKKAIPEKGVESYKQIVKGTSSWHIMLTEGDPIGEYRIVLYINDEEANDVIFTIYSET